MESTVYVFVTLCFRLVNVWLYLVNGLCLCVTVCYVTVTYLVDIQEWGLKTLINNTEKI